MEFLYGPDGQALRLSGIDLTRTAGAHAADAAASWPSPSRTLAGATSKLADELADLAATDPDRCRILILTGSYAEARDAADYLNGLPEWAGRVTTLISDDADYDDAWATLPGGGGRHGRPAAPGRRRVVRRAPAARSSWPRCWPSSAGTTS